MAYLSISYNHSFNTVWRKKNDLPQESMLTLSLKSSVWSERQFKFSSGIVIVCTKQIIRPSCVQNKAKISCRMSRVTYTYCSLVTNDDEIRPTGIYCNQVTSINVSDTLLLLWIMAPQTNSLGCCYYYYEPQPRISAYVARSSLPNTCRGAITQTRGTDHSRRSAMTSRSIRLLFIIIIIIIIHA